MRLVLAGILLLLMAACSRDDTPGREAVDLVFHDGRVLVLDADFSEGSVLVVDDGRIVAVGGDELRSRYAGDREVDLRGRTLMPGFNDSHTHIDGRPQRFVDLTETRSIAELKAQVADKADELGPGEWISGYGWSEDQMLEQRRPLRDDLDEAAPNNPVLLDRAGGHSAVMNSFAFRLAEIDENTADPDSGIIEKDANGRLNGIIRERQDIVSRLIPEATDAEVRDDLVAQLRDQFRYGITSLTQAWDTIDHYAEWMRIYDAQRGSLPRARVQVSWQGPEAMRAFGRKTGDGDAYLQVGPVKIFADGGFTGPAAYTNEPYKGETDYRGKLTMTPDELMTIVREANAAGWQLGIHAIGDAAIELVVEDIVQALQSTPRSDHRHYLNHFTIMPSAETMDSMAANGIAITQQPNFTYTLDGRYSTYLDGDRLLHNNPLRTPIDHGVFVALSSDILPIGPMVGLYAATTRKGMSGRVFAADEALTLNEALRAYTYGGAWLSFEEGVKGTLEPGRYADLIVLDRDISAVSGEELMDVAVDQTWLGGNLVYERADVTPSSR